MATTNQAVFTIGQDMKSMRVERTFDAPLNRVWSAWTESALLDLWWAPKPWRAETKQMGFKPGGTWLYAMVGPAGERHWARVDYSLVEPNTHFQAVDSFCDENGVISQEMPGMNWDNKFEDQGDSTRLVIDITFSTPEALQKIVQMGFKDGFAMGLGNLDELLAR